LLPQTPRHESKLTGWALRDRDEGFQRRACARFGEKYGPELGKKLKDKLRLVEPEVKLEAAVKAAVVPIKPKPAPKPKPADEDEEKKAAIAFKRRYGWAEVAIPNGVGQVEALTYVPGLVGQIVEWIVSGARRPNRVMALGVALAVVGTLMGRRFEGPTGNATHVYIFILAPTGWGRIIRCGVATS